MEFLFEYIPYIFAITVILIILFFTFLRMKYGFWYHQPVHHVYDFRYHIFPPGLIMESLPEKNKYTNFKEITTTPFEKLSELEITQFTNFIRTNFLKNGENIFSPTKENIVPYFTGFTQPSYFSFYKIPNILLDSKDKQLIEDTKIIGVMTGRPMSVNIKSQDPFDVYYIDYLCVDMDYRKKGTAPQIIQTHEYNQRHLNKRISVCLFKREGQLTGIVPICIYDMYCFDSFLWKKPNITLHASFNIVKTGKNNIHLAADFLKKHIYNFEISIIPEMANIYELIRTENIHLYFLVQDVDIVSIYVFRKSCTFIENGREILTLIASINGGVSPDIFMQGFKMAYWEIVKKNNSYSYVVIENISHNNYIADILKNSFKPVVILPAAYFFYNFAYSTFNSNKTFILN